MALRDLARTAAARGRCDDGAVFLAASRRSMPSWGEGYQTDDPSRGDRVVLTDEPADEIPAPDLRDLIDRGDRGRILRDR